MKSPTWQNVWELISKPCAEASVQIRGLVITSSTPVVVTVAPVSRKMFRPWPEPQEIVATRLDY